MSEDELEAIRQRKLAELQAQADAEQKQGAEREVYEQQKAAAIREILTPEARERLGNVRLAKPDVADSIEVQLIQLAQSGRLAGKVTDEQLKELLRSLQKKKRDTKITFRR